MGSRKSATTVSKILLAFLDDTTWSQTDLAKRCGITVKALRPHLLALKGDGVPLSSEAEHQRGVLWSVPNGWFPGGATLEQADVSLIARFVARSPTSAERERLLRRLLRFTSGKVVRSSRTAAVAEEVIRTLEASVAEKHPIRLRYFSTRAGELLDAVVSVHAVEHGDRLRFVGVVEGGALRWFRSDGIERVAIATDLPYYAVPDEIVRAFLEASVDGFHAGGEAAPYEFFVRSPEARWVSRNLPQPLRVVKVEGGVLVCGRSAALPVIAAYVVGLGDAARVLSENLRREVVRLARGALRINERALRKGLVRSLGSKRATG